MNPLSLLYMTVVGLFLVPGTHFENMSVARAALVDVRSGVVLTLAEADTTVSAIRPALIGRPFETLRERAGTRVLESLRGELGEELAAGSPPPPDGSHSTGARIPSPRGSPSRSHAMTRSPER